MRLGTPTTAIKAERELAGMGKRGAMYLIPKASRNEIKNTLPTNQRWSKNIAGYQYE